MSSIIKNAFFRALTRIEEYTGIKNMTVKELTIMLVDELYPEDGHISLEDDFRGNFRLRMSDEFMARIREESLKGKDVNSIIEEAMVKGPPEPAPAEVVVPVAEPVEEPKVKPVKLTKEEKEAAKAAKEAEKKAKEEAKEAEKKAKEDATAAKVKADAEAKEAKAKAPKAKFVGNLEKLTPTQDKLFKKVCEGQEVPADAKTKFLAYANALDNKDFNAKKLEEHMKEFLEPKPVTSEQELWPVDYKGKEYGVNDKGEVYEDHELDSGETVAKKVGNVGMAYFKDMEQPTD